MRSTFFSSSISRSSLSETSTNPPNPNNLRNNGGTTYPARATCGGSGSERGRIPPGVHRCGHLAESIARGVATSGILPVSPSALRPTAAPSVAIGEAFVSFGSCLLQTNA